MECKRKSVGAPGAREERARGGLAALALALVIALATVPDLAKADIAHMPSTNADTQVGWVWPYGPNDGAAALCEILGYNWDSFSDEVKEKIRTEDLGTAGPLNPFTYLLTSGNTFDNDSPPHFYNVQETLNGVPVIGEMYEWILSTFGANKIWAFNFSDASIDAAREHVKKWAYPRESGDDSGTGYNGSYDPTTGAVEFVPGSTGAYMEVNAERLYNCPFDNYKWTELITGNFNIPSEYWEHEGVPLLCVCVWTSRWILIYGYAEDWEYVYNSYGHPTGLKNISSSSKYLWFSFEYTNGAIIQDGVTITGSTSPVQATVNKTYSGTLTFRQTANWAPGQQNPLVGLNSEVMWIAAVGGNGHSGQPYNPVIKPDTPPDLPGPNPPGYTPATPGTHTHNDNNVNVTVKVTLPTNYHTVYYTIYNEENNTYTTYNNPSSGADVLDVIRNWYTDWQHHTVDLMGWFENLEDQIIDADNKIIESLRHLIMDGIDRIKDYIDAVNQQIVDAANNISYNLDEMAEWIVTELDEIITGAINSIGEYFEDAVQSLEDYMEEVSEYLVESLFFEFDDGDIKTLLQRILRKMEGNTASPDLGTDPEGFWDWLMRMFEEFFEGLIDDATDGIEDVAEGLLGLATKFPFSIPWDIYAILTLFVAEPVTPVFDFPMPVPEVVDQQGYVELEVDLSPYDDVAAVLRHLQTLAFIIWICGEIPGWLNQLKIGTGGNKDD